MTTIDVGRISHEIAAKACREISLQASQEEKDLEAEIRQQIQKEIDRFIAKDLFPADLSLRREQKILRWFIGVLFIGWIATIVLGGVYYENRLQELQTPLPGPEQIQPE